MVRYHGVKALLELTDLGSDTVVRRQGRCRGAHTSIRPEDRVALGRCTIALNVTL